MKDMPGLVRRKFYRDSANLSADAIKVAVQRQQALTTRTRTGWLRNGEFLPISVWEKNGYDKEAILAGCKEGDYYKDPQFNWTVYRVPVYSEQSGHEQEHEDKVDLSGRRHQKAALKRKASHARPKMVPVSDASDDAASGFSDSAGDGEDSDLDDESLASSRSRKRKAPKTTKVAAAAKPKKLSREEQKAAREEKKKAEQAKREDKKQATAQLKKVSTLVI